ncbi:MAG: hypothetical protein OXN83_05400 [Oligoflexia bacterium]|nr:hypothetical protein [Oligoflexia bacterium]
MRKTILNNDFFKQVFYKKAGLKDQIGLINCPAFIKFLLQISFSLEYLLSVSNTLRHKRQAYLKLNLYRFIEILRQVRDMILQSLKLFLDRLNVILDLKSKVFVTKTYRIIQPKAISLDTKARIKLAQTVYLILQSYKPFALKVTKDFIKLESLNDKKDMKISYEVFKSWGRRELILIDKSLRKRGFSLGLKLGFMKKFVWVRCQQWRQQGLFKKSGKAFRLKAFHHQPIPTTPPHLV